jgi:hypothetical protein
MAGGFFIKCAGIRNSLKYPEAWICRYSGAGYRKIQKIAPACSCFGCCPHGFCILLKSAYP